MAQLSVPLPPKLQRYVDARAVAEGFDDPADYVRDLIRRDQDDFEADVQRVQKLIDEGAGSGIVDGEPEELLRQVMAETSREHG